jgi:hypothetical protein
MTHGRPLKWPLVAESGLYSRVCSGRKSDRFIPKAAVKLILTKGAANDPKRTSQYLLILYFVYLFNIAGRR